MSTNNTSQGGERAAYFHRWEIVLVLLSLLVSGLSLWMSLRTERAGASPNVQVQSVEGSRSHMTVHGDSGEAVEEKVSVKCTAVLKNHGRAPVQIVNVRWEPVSVGEPLNREMQWIAISDGRRPTDEAVRDYFYGLRSNPVLGIQNPVLSPGETKALEIAFEGDSAMEKGQDTPNIRVILVLSNGVEVTILPEIKYRVIGGSY